MKSRLKGLAQLRGICFLTCSSVFLTLALYQLHFLLSYSGPPRRGLLSVITQQKKVPPPCLQHHLLLSASCWEQAENGLFYGTVRWCWQMSANCNWALM